jgi:hypothetical protein
MENPVKNRIDMPISTGTKKFSEWRITMSKCKNGAADMLVPTKTHVSVTVNVTNIVKYVSLAGVAIVGIIFGTKSYIECMKVQKTGSEKN